LTPPRLSELPRNTLLIGDVRTRLRELPDASVHCVITSPPYFALRDYAHTDQIGAEATIDAWADAIVAVCTELARVLRPDGALWLNLGDGYSRHPREGAARKSLLLGPQRVALRLTQSGWLLRNNIVWAKRNPLPSSATDRLTTTHEALYFLTRSARYNFDLNAIRELDPPGAPSRQSRPRRNGGNHYPPRGAVPGLNGATAPRVDLNHGLAAMKTDGLERHPLGKNPGDVWWLTTANYKGAHFATFPLELIRRPLLATCPQRACARCGLAWRHATQVINGRKLAIGPLQPNCRCEAGWRPGVVLDPFMGSGTVALAAEQYGRDWAGIELNPAYAALAEQRLREWRDQQCVPAQDTS
jgi:DNA modification methylase